MSRVDAVAAMDRLPWLSDEPENPQPAKRRSGVFAWAAIAIVLVAGAGFWMGAHSVDEHPAPAVHRAQTSTIRLPQARPAQAPEVRIPTQPQVKSAPAQEVRPAPVREVRIAPPVQRSASHEAVGSTASSEQSVQEVARPIERQNPAPAPAIAPPISQPVLLRAWPPRVIPGAAGRLVQIGAFGSTHQAKRGWWFMVRAYPAVAHLPAVVTVTRNSKGRAFYRFQVGTTSQAHSEVLCQRMQRIHLSCAVVGLPWKAKVER